jgi:hypothetical protein
VDVLELRNSPSELDADIARVADALVAGTKAQ